MPNVKLTICYDGSNYAGWQTQVGCKKVSCQKALPGESHVQRTIQGEIEQALLKIFQKKTKIIGSGRTDAGVHAVGQVANFKIDKQIGLDDLRRSLNGILPKDISIAKAETADDGFHARFDAKMRVYRYVIINGPQKPVFNQKWALWVKHPLNIALMRRELRALCGRHDFSSFQAADHIDRNPVVFVREAVIKKVKHSEALPFFPQCSVFTIDLSADRFLRNMVRNVIGTLIEIGRGKMPAGTLRKVLLRKDRKAAGPCVSGCGLYLLGVRYD